MENQKNQSKKKHERLASSEEMATHKRLIDGCDQFYFGIDGEPQSVPEPATGQNETPLSFVTKPTRSD